MPADLSLLGDALPDRYVIERELGSGGMAIVFLAEDLKHRRKVAIKVLRPELAATLGPERFLQEIETSARLNHPHILGLIDSGEAAGFLYYVMPYVEGESLRERLRRDKRLSVEDALQIASEVADGLGYAHREGVIHRDVKPGNILLSQGHAVIADFGIAKAVVEAGGRTDTATGIAIGSPTYMSPEQAEGSRDLDARSDIYSLGCLLYEMITGEPPFSGRSYQAVLAHHAVDPVPAIAIRGVPPQVKDAVSKALSKSPEDRFQSAFEFAKALQATGARLTLKHERVPLRRRLRPQWSRAWIALAGAVSVLVVVVLLIVSSDQSFAFAERDWILVADFETPEDDPGLGLVMRQLVSSKLEQTTYISTVPRDQVRDARRAAGVADSVPLDATLARNLAVRTSVRVILLGGIHRIGEDTYSLVLHVDDAESGSNLFSVARSVRDEGDAVVRAVEELVDEVRTELGERREAIEATQPLSSVTTPSLPAFRAYADGIQSILSGDFDGSNRHLHRALAIDTSFAAAWALMAGNYSTARQTDSAKIAYREALRIPERLSDAERYRLRADAAYALDGDLAKALRWYDLYLVERPNSIAARNNRALYLSALGEYREAAAELAVASTIDPLRRGPRQNQLLNLTAALVVLGDRDSAQIVSAKLEGSFAEYAELLLLSARGEWVESLSQSREIATDPETQSYVRIFAGTSWAAALAAQGSVQAAERVLDDLAADSRGAHARWYRRARVLLSLVSGRTLPSIPAALEQDTTVGGRLLTSMWHAARGDTTSARDALSVVATLDARALERFGHSPEYIEALIRSEAGDWNGVIELLRDIARLGEHDPFSLDRVDSFSMRWLVATAFAETEQTQSATAYLQLVIDPTGVPPAHFSLRGIPYSFARSRLDAAE